ncbi:MAG: LapA family protein [Nitrosomonas sp.]|jgi:putative membrane protein|uniref:LapA family protein n=2 Tax=Nitrosomonas sp. TaxID=42353 RepID=UPI00271AA9C3|nr:LapA family protein [Nitrosomonas sp.]MBK6958201.1 LapA family protein [Nitrosomonas sp.]MDO8894722.1 LapA family protein [Nitrosomonas sp.]MDP1934329.1 LapA family protein [Nitrosomonas sp.]MDP2223295.1 LapA family protein [Nitrosomonas sp.]MDP3282774.1 LapA family protein [Nitrosomonas sp.]
MMNLIAWLLRIVLFAVFAVFASLNTQPVTLHYYLDQSIELPLSVALLIFFALGTVITAIFVRCRCHSNQ